MSQAELTGEQALASFAECHQRKGYMPSTIALEQRLLRAALPKLGRTPAKVTREEVRSYLASRAERIRAASAEREFTVLRNFFQFLLEEGHLAANPTDGLAPHAHGGARVPLVLSRVAVERLLAEALTPPKVARSQAVRRGLALRNRALLELLYGLGLRASEAAAILVIDLNLPEGSMLVRRVKRGPRRVLPLPKATIPHLEAYLREGRGPLLRGGGRDGGRLLITDRGTPLDGNEVLVTVKALGKRAGIHVHPHAIRRSLATHMVQDGASLVSVREMLGHARLDTTQRYVAVDRSDLRQAVEALERPAKHE